MLINTPSAVELDVNYLPRVPLESEILIQVFQMQTNNH